MENQEKITKFLDLSDDNLLEILEYLPWCDVHRLFQVHPRFDHAIALVLRKLPVHINIAADDLNTEKKFEDFLRIFGFCVKELIIGQSGTIPKSVNEYCTGGNVTQCTFYHVRLDDDFVQNSGSLFKCLKSLTLDEVTIGHETFDKILKMCTRLTELNLAANEGFEVGIDYLLSTIETYDIEKLCLGISLDEDDIENAPISTSVKHLEVSLVEDDVSLLQHFPRIESLKLVQFDSFDLSSLPVPDMSTLTSLLIEFHCVTVSNLTQFFETLAESNRLESLVISGLHEIIDGISDTQFLLDPEIIGIFGRMTKLKVLKFHPTVILNQNFWALANNLKELREFHAFSIYQPISETKEIICGFVARSKNLRKLSFAMPASFNFYDEFYDELDQICAKQNRSTILRVEISTYHGSESMFIQKQGKLIQMSVISWPFCFVSRILTFF